jgi:hypothetical protein
MPKRWCIGCGDLFDLDLTGTLRCPACQATATAKRQARPNTTRRGYGGAHQKLRAKLLAEFVPGQLCARCRKPITTKADAQLGHVDADRSRYRGLEHTRCNEATSGR